MHLKLQPAARVTYLQFGVRGIDESISQNGVPVLYMGATGVKRGRDKRGEIIQKQSAV